MAFLWLFTFLGRDKDNTFIFFSPWIWYQKEGVVHRKIIDFLCDGVNEQVLQSRFDMSIMNAKGTQIWMKSSLQKTISNPNWLPHVVVRSVPYAEPDSVGVCGQPSRNQGRQRKGHCADRNETIDSAEKHSRWEPHRLCCYFIRKFWSCPRGRFLRFQSRFPMQSRWNLEPYTS